MAVSATAVARIRRVPGVAAAIAIGLGLALLEGYVYGVVPLVPTALFLPPAQPLDAVLFVLTGIALLAVSARADQIRLFFAAVAATIAALLLGEYLLHVSLPLDAWLFFEQTSQLSRLYPGRPAPLACVAFLLLDLLLVIAPAPGAPPRRWYSALLLGAAIIPLLALAGHVGGVPALYGLARGSGVAPHAALGLLVLSVGVTAATAPGPLGELLTAREPGTVLLRRLLPLAVGLPLLFAIGSVHALGLGLYQVHAKLSAFVALFIAGSLWAVFRYADVARRLDAERQAADQARADLVLRNRLLEAETEAQAALQASEAHTRELLDILTHAPVTARGIDGPVRFWSAGAERLYGWTADEALRAAKEDLLRTELPVPRCEAEAALVEHGEWLGECTRRRRDGTTLRIATHWILHRTAAGLPDAVIEVDDDVTEQRRAEAAMRGSEARYRALVAATARIVWTLAANGRDAGDFSQWEAFTGQTIHEATHGGWIRAILPEDQPEATRAWSEAIRTRTALATRHRLRRHDGEYRHMELRMVPVLDAEGMVREWVGAHTDVTERVRAEEQLGQAQKLQAVGTLAGGVAHEVNNQLMAVLGFGEFVLKELGPDHPQRPDVDEMIRAAMRASKVAQQLLTFSRRQVHQVRPLSLHAAVVALAPVLGQLLGADKSLTILPDRARSRVLADPTQVDQVLINLAANARDAMATTGRLTIGVDEATLDEAWGERHGIRRMVPGPYVQLTVSDDGCGMDRETLDKIFEPFFTTKPVGSGTGLGLSTVYGILKQHDGFIWAYSEPGLGTTLTLYFPATPRAASDAVEPAAELPADRQPLPSGLVLVVEDDPAVRQLVRRSLESVGLTVLEAEDGVQALDAVSVRRVQPALVLTDVIMPGLNGRELSERLAADRPELPVLFMSGYTGEDVQARSLLPANAQFIQKPFGAEALVERVRAMLAPAGNGGS